MLLLNLDCKDVECEGAQKGDVWILVKTGN